MYDIKGIFGNARQRCQAEREHEEITRSLDALALTELGYPPKEVGVRQRPWFLYL